MKSKNSFYIKDILISNNLVLAPMAGISNASYIKIVEDMGCGLAFSELISAEAIYRNNKKTFEMLNGIDKLNIPVGIQIFGANAKTLASAAKTITKLYSNCFIDINMGCPVAKVAISAQAGSALLKNPQKIKGIVEEVVNSVNVPVTVKIRSGWDDEHINAVEVAKICEEAGASAITVHARTRAQGYSGSADYNIIKDVKANVNIPVIGNGDVINVLKAKEMIEYTKCDAVMIGRAAIGNPWIFKECYEYLNNNEVISKPSYIEKINMIKYHYELLKQNKNEKVALLEIRTHALAYLKGLKDAKLYKEKLCQAKSEKEFFDILNDYEQSFNI